MNTKILIIESFILPSLNFLFSKIKTKKMRLKHILFLIFLCITFYHFYLVPTADISFIMNDSDDRYAGLMLPCPCAKGTYNIDQKPKPECLHDCVMINILEKIKTCKETNSFCDAEKMGGGANCQDTALAIYTHMADLGGDRSCDIVLNGNLVAFFEDDSVLYTYAAFLEEMKNIKANNICVIEMSVRDPDQFHYFVLEFRENDENEKIFYVYSSWKNAFRLEYFLGKNENPRDHMPDSRPNGDKIDGIIKTLRENIGEKKYFSIEKLEYVLQKFGMFLYDLKKYGLKLARIYNGKREQLHTYMEYRFFCNSIHPDYIHFEKRL